MEPREISALLKKYNAGETSLKQESELRNYFTTTPEIPAAWQPYRLLFGYFTKAKKEAHPDPKNKLFIFRPWMAVAAMVAIIFTVFYTNEADSNDLDSDQASLQLAFEQFQSNIKLVSTHLNRGTEQLAYLDYWNTTTEKLIK